MIMIIQWKIVMIAIMNFNDISDISDTLTLTAQAIKDRSENEQLNCLLMVLMKLQRKCDINEQMVVGKKQQQLNNHKEEIKENINNW